MNSSTFAEHVADKPVQETERKVTFTPGQVVEAVNGAYKGLGIPGNAEVGMDGKNLRIKWKERP